MHGSRGPKLKIKILMMMMMVVVVVMMMMVFVFLHPFTLFTYCSLKPMR
jgi:hypothetical protein